MVHVKVILASYNGEQWISEQIESLLDQEDVNVSIMYFDDASTDGTVSKIEKYLRANDRFHRNQTRLGSAGRNFLNAVTLLDLTDCDYVAFCDQDDIWFSDKLSSSISFLESNGYDGISSQVKAFWDDGKTQILKQNDKTTDYDYFFEGAGQGCTFVLKASVLRGFSSTLSMENKNLHLIHYHDWLVYAFFRCKGYRWGFLSTPTMLYRQHSSNDTGSKGTLAGIKKRIRLISNGWYKNQITYVIEYCKKINSFSEVFLRDTSIICGTGTMNYFKRLIIVLFKSRRKFTDRSILFFLCLIGKF